jgi:hypothetical protein
MDGSFRADASRLGLSPPVSLFVVALRRWHVSLCFVQRKLILR